MTIGQFCIHGNPFPGVRRLYLKRPTPSLCFAEQPLQAHFIRMSQPRLVIEETAAADNSEHSESATTVPALPSSIPFFLAPATADTKRSILKSNLRAYEADPVKLTPGLDPSHLSTSPIAEPVLTGPKVKFSSIDEIFQASESDQIIRRGIDQLHFTLPLNSPLLKPVDETSNSASANLNRFQTPPLQSAGAPMNSPYSRMCDQLEHFVDAESDVADTILINRPLNERNLSVDLSPELEKISMLSFPPAIQSPQSSQPSATNPLVPLSESRSLWLGKVDPTVTEEDICLAFAPFGAIENVRLLPAKECAFVNYFEIESAIQARNAMQGRPLGNMILRIGFGKISDPIGGARDMFTSSSLAAISSSENTFNQSRSIWIGNIGPEITCDILMLHFNIFGPIESCRILEGKNCAFVNYYSPEAASIAKTKMNGVLIGNSTLKTGHAKDTNSTNLGSNFNLTNEPIFNLMKSVASQPTPAPVTFASITATIEEDPNPSTSLGLGSSPSLTLDGNQLREFRRIIETSPEEIPNVLKKLLESCQGGDFKELSVDSYGNILLQKMIERAEVGEQSEILKALKGNLTEVSKHKNGTWVIQKLITSCPESIQNETIEELKEKSVELLEDQFGNYVIQCILTNLTTANDKVRYILDKIIQNIRKLAVGKFSSRALKSILESSNLERQKMFANALAKESVLLSVDPNGAVVIQWILDSEFPGKVALVTGQLQGRLAQIALTKQGSVIVARIVGCTDEPKYRDEAILELFELSSFEESDSVVSGFKTSSKTTSHLDSLLTEPSTCSILFKAYQVSKPSIRLRLTKRLQPKLMKILKEITGDADEQRIRTYSDKEREEKIPVHLMKLYQELIQYKN